LEIGPLDIGDLPRWRIAIGNWQSEIDND